jgi:hypothetical protein
VAVVIADDIIDAHVHVVDFLQSPVKGAELEAAMDRAGVARAVVFGLPVKKKWAHGEPRKPHYYLDGNDSCYYFGLTDQIVADLYLGAADDLRARWAPTLCGFDPTDQLAMDHVEWMWSRYPFWRGIGEVLLRHDDLTNLTAGELPSAAHPALDPVFDFARDRGVPLAVHHDSSSAGRPAEHEYVPQLDRMLRRHPGTTVVWCHAGVARRIAPQRQGQVVGELLDAHAGLHIDVSWSLLATVLDDKTPDPDWVRLIERRPDRFVVGSDVVGRPEQLQSSLAEVRMLLAALTPTARRLVGAQNAERLWFG